MAFLLRSTSKRPSSIRWIRNAAQTRIDGEKEDENEDGSQNSLFDLQLGPDRDRSRAFDTPSDVALGLPSEDRPAYKQFHMPETVIPLSTLQPDFASTAVGKILIDMGMKQSDFERFAERNPRAFHSTTEETIEWIRSFREKLNVSNDELIELLKIFPKLLTVASPRVEKINSILEQRLKLNSKELRSIVLSNPFVYDTAFEVRFEKAMIVLYEKFKITSSDVKRLVRIFPQFLTLVEEGQLARMVSLFSRVINLGVNQVGRIIKDCPQLLGQSIFGLHERIIFLLHYKITESQVRDMILQCPSMLDTRYTSELRHVVNYLEAALNVDWRVIVKIIVREPSIMKMDTDTEIAPNLAAMKNLKFTSHETALMLTRCPGILKLNLTDADTKAKLDLLGCELHHKRNDLVTYPNYLTFSLSDHLRPRVAFMKSLQREDYKQWPLMKLFGDTDEEFCIRHVKTRPEKYQAFKEKWMQRP